MLNTKSKGHRPSGSGEKDFQKVFTIYGHGCQFGYVTKTICIHFGQPILKSLHKKIEFNLRKLCLNILMGLQYERPLLKGQRSTLPLKLIYSHCLIRFSTYQVIIMT